MKISNILGYLGVIPFAISLFYLDSYILDTGIKGQNLFIFYSVAILSFLSGTLWQPNSNEVKTALVSNIFCLFAVFAIFLPLNFGLLWLASGYLLLWYFEYRLRKSNLIERNREYVVLRGKLTVIVVSIHLFAIFNMTA